jgi:pimeloyl-ACP methyl ester carboxylesterase
MMWGVVAAISEFALWYTLLIGVVSALVTLVSFTVMIYDQAWVAKLRDARGDDYLPKLQEALGAKRSSLFVEAVVREWIVTWLLTLVYPLGALWPNRVLTPWHRFSLPRLRSTGMAPVLMVHGYTQTRHHWVPLARHLRRQGHPVFSVNLPTLYRSVPDQADVLARSVDWALAQAQADRLVIVAHSMGGLVSRCYIAQKGGHAKVAGLVTLGTPHEGTRMAFLAYTPHLIDLCPDSPFLRELEAAEAAPPLISRPTPLLSITSRYDQMLLPFETALVAAPAESWAAEDLGHLGYMLDGETFMRVAAFTGRFAARSAASTQATAPAAPGTLPPNAGLAGTR